MKHRSRRCAQALAALAWTMAWGGGVRAAEGTSPLDQPPGALVVGPSDHQFGGSPSRESHPEMEEGEPHPERHGPPKPSQSVEPEADESLAVDDPQEVQSSSSEPLLSTRAAMAPPFGIDGFGAPHATVDPPDPQIAVGPPVAGTTGFIVEAYHRGLTYFQKSGARAGVQLFSSLFGPTNLFDPRLVFDPYLQRFVLLVLRPGANAGATPAEVHLAVSSGPDPRLPWTTFSWPVPNLPIPVHPDFPSLGYDRQNLYVGMNLLNYPIPGGPLVLTWFVAIDKTQLVGSGNLHKEEQLRQAGDFLPWAPRAAEQLDLPVNAPPVGLFVASLKGIPGPQPNPFTRLTVYKWRHPFTPQSNLISADVTVPAHEPPRVDAPQSCGTGDTLDVLSGQLLNAVWRAGDLYTAHTIWAGAAAPNRVRWYQLRSGPPQAPVWWTQLAQSGLILTQTTSGAHSLSPAIGVDAQLSVALVFAQSSTLEHPRLLAAGRAACEPVGVIGAPVTLMTSSACNTTCTPSGGCPPYRWGDYFGIAVDPSAPGKLWSVGEYFPDSNNWGTWISSLEVNPSCGPCTCQP